MKTDLSDIVGGTLMGIGFTAIILFFSILGVNELREQWAKTDMKISEYQNATYQQATPNQSYPARP